jgi:DNA-binding beta-propeller fold protein YncE
VRNVGVLGALLVACLLSGVVATDASAAVGDLKQKPAPAGCTSETGAGACANGTALANAYAVTVSPDGKNAYVASGGSNAVAIFDRGADGTLTQKPAAAGCISDTGDAPCVNGTGLVGAYSVTVSPDGKNAYVASAISDAVAILDRAADGTLTQKLGTAACISQTGAGPCAAVSALDQPTGVTISPDGTSAYVASNVSDAVAVFDRAADGTLTQKLGTAACISQTGVAPCADGTGLDGARSVTVSPDGKSAYVASDVSDSVAVFDRAADGTLTQKPGPAGCVSDTGAGPCLDGTALANASSVTVSPDGRNAYVASVSNSVAVFDRAANGTLTQKPGPAGCISETGAGPCLDGTALVNASSVTISPDGKDAYVASTGSNAVAAFTRAADGTLTQRPGAAACVSETGAAPCVDGTGLANPASVTVSPDGRNAYVASTASSAVAVFDRERLSAPAPPAPAPGPTASLPLPLACSHRLIVLLDVHRAKRRVEVSGLAHPAFRGQRTRIRALIKGSRPVYATIQADGSFRTTLPLPARKRLATVRYQATIGQQRSAALKLARKLTIVSSAATAAGTRITAQLSSSTGRQKVTIDRQLTCTTYRRVKTVRTDRRGRFTITLPKPLAPDLVASYRARTQRSHGRTYSLPIAVRR